MNEPLMCQCGCGEVIPPRPNHRRYRPRYILSHWCKLPNSLRVQRVRAAKTASRLIPPTDWKVPTGICECGCGLPTNICHSTCSAKGRYAGFPYRYRRGHAPLLREHGSAHPAWRGGRSIDYCGYVTVSAPDHPAQNKGRVAEHRLVFEQAHGIRLKATDVVHHINGNRTDNRIDNLVMTTRSGHMFIHGHDPRPPITPELRAIRSAAGKKGSAIRWARHKPLP